MLNAAAIAYTVRDHDVIVDTPINEYVLRVKDMPDEEKPRERLMELGVKNLSVSELIAIVWGVGTRKEEVLAMAKRTLKDYGEKAIVNEVDPVKLAASADIPPYQSLPAYC